MFSEGKGSIGTLNGFLKTPIFNCNMLLLEQQDQGRQ